MADDQFQTKFNQLPGEDDLVKYDYDYDSDTGAVHSVSENEEEEDDDDDNEEKEIASADVGSGWGRIVYSPVRRGKLVEMDVCRATNREGTEGCFERIAVTRRKNPTLHNQARRSQWGDLWPF